MGVCGPDTLAQPQNSIGTRLSQTSVTADTGELDLKLPNGRANAKLSELKTN